MRNISLFIMIEYFRDYSTKGWVAKKINLSKKGIFQSGELSFKYIEFGVGNTWILGKKLSWKILTFGWII